ncbi:HNH endonuclease [Streptomyces sp. NPDC005955]|uniref:HNH endonuclease n=1 Tax=Streptomyces sp. NPDC005955 TaxID=3364738 RepID=UPI00369D2711
MAQSEVTRTEVLQALAEYDRLGRDAFLDRYGFHRARTYLLVHAGRSYDSKAVLGAAHGFLPGRRPLRARDLSGGADHAVRVLRALGFEVVRASFGEEELMALVSRLKVSHHPVDGPSRYQPLTLLWAIGRAVNDGQRLLPWTSTDERLRPLLAAHGRPHQRNRPEYPLAALHRAGLWDMVDVEGPVPPAHGDAALKAWFTRQRPTSGLVAPVHDLVRRSGLARLRAVDHLLATYFGDLDHAPLLADVGLDGDRMADDLAPASAPAPGPDVPAGPAAPVTPVVPVYEEAPASSHDPLVLAAHYERLCQLVEGGEAERHGRRTERTTSRPVRSAAARRAVFERSGGRCENPGCPGQPVDVTDRGTAILEIDHVDPLAGGGRDHPAGMIALCPNCHAVKTRGRTRHHLAERLLAVARERHAALWGRGA